MVELVTTFKEERDAGALVPVFKEKVGHLDLLIEKIYQVNHTPHRGILIWPDF